MIGSYKVHDRADKLGGGSSMYLLFYGIHLPCLIEAENYRSFQTPFFNNFQVAVTHPPKPPRPSMLRYHTIRRDIFHFLLYLSISGTPCVHIDTLCMYSLWVSHPFCRTYNYIMYNSTKKKNLCCPISFNLSLHICTGTGFATICWDECEKSCYLLIIRIGSLSLTMSHASVFPPPNTLLQRPLFFLSCCGFPLCSITTGGQPVLTSQ